LFGVVYESMVGSTFRGELGSYFTPRNVADFMAGVVSPKSGERVFDPACGSGGLLIASEHRLRTDASSEAGVGLRLFGNDLNPRMVRAAKLNFLLHRQPPQHVAQGDGLKLTEVLQKL